MMLNFHNFMVKFDDWITLLAIAGGMLVCCWLICLGMFAILLMILKAFE